jgi:hypothetical protein
MARAREPSSILLVTLLAVRVVILAVVFINVQRNPVTDSDINRFQEIGELRGTPWRDAPVEFPPGQVIAIKLLVGGTLERTAIAVAVCAFAADVLTAALLARVWSRRACAAYLLLGLPLMPFMYLRLDPLAVLLAVAGMASIRRQHHALGGAILGFAGLTRLWPIILLPYVFIEGQRRAVVAACATLAVGGLAWIWWGGPGALGDVVSFRGASGWQIASTIGVLVWIRTGGPIRTEAGAFRVGAISHWASWITSAAVVGLACAIGFRQRRRADRADGRVAVAAIATLLVLSPVLSQQYVFWLLPWMAVAYALERDDRMMGLGLVIAILTTLPDALVDTVGLLQAVIVVRNALLAWLVLRYLIADPVRTGDPVLSVA